MIPCCQVNNEENRAKWIKVIKDHNRKTGEDWSIVLNAAKQLEAIPAKSLIGMKIIIPNLVTIFTNK